MREKLAALTARIEEARYAMVGGSLEDEPVPVAVIARWLKYIEEGVPDGGGVTFEDGWLFEGGTIIAGTKMSLT